MEEIFFLYLILEFIKNFLRPYHASSPPPHHTPSKIQSQHTIKSPHPPQSYSQIKGVYPKCQKRLTRISPHHPIKYVVFAPMHSVSLRQHAALVVAVSPFPRCAVKFSRRITSFPCAMKEGRSVAVRIMRALRSR